MSSPSPAEVPASARRRGGGRWRHLASVALTFAGLAFVLVLAHRHRSEVVLWLHGLDGALAACAILALLASTLGAGVVFRGLTDDATHGDASPRPSLLAVFLLSQVAKYVPGRVWTLLLQHLVLAGRVPAGRVLYANLEIALMALVTTIGAAVAFWAGWAHGWAWTLPLVAGLVVLVRLLLEARLSLRLRAVLCRLVPAMRAAGPPALGSGRSASVGSLLFVLGYCAGWIMLMRAAGMDLPSALHVAALLSVSYVVGLLSLLPAGLGAREAALLALGAWSSWPAPALTSIAILTRLAMVMVDVLSAMLAASWYWWKRNP